MIRQVIFLTLISAYYAHAEHSTARHDNVNFAKNCMTEQCANYYEKILASINKTVDPCENSYMYYCNGDFSGEPDTTNWLKDLVKPLLKSGIPFSESDDFIDDYKKEQEFYQKCKKFNPHNAEWASANWDMMVPVEKFLDSSWSPVNQMTSLGSFIFFDISVEHNPQTGKNIIVLRPPPYYSEYIKNALVSLELVHRTISEYLNDDDRFGNSVEVKEEEDCVIDDSESDSTSCKKSKLNEIYQKTKGDLEYMIGHMSYTFNTFRYKITDIGQWIEDYNAQIIDQDVEAKIDWMKIFADTFDEREMSKNEPLLVYNPEYFTEVYKFLIGRSNDEMALFALTKRVSENLGYLNWEIIQSQESQSDGYDDDAKSDFCLKEMKHYVMSNYLYVTKVKDDKLAMQVFNNIVKTIESKISNSQELSTQTKNLFLRKLHIITHDINVEQMKNFLKNDYDYYQGLELIDNHLMNVLNYREVVKRRILEKLRSRESTPITPLTYTFDDAGDLDVQNSNLFNYFLFYMMNHDMSKYPVEEIYYATFGAKMAEKIYLTLIYSFDPEVQDFNKKRITCLSFFTHENLEENVEKNEENSEQNVEGNSEVNVEENPEKNVEENSEDNSDDNVKENSEVNAEENSVNNVKGSSEENVEENPVNNVEGSSEENVEENPENNVQENSEVNVEENPENNVEGNSEVNVEENSVNNVEGSSKENVEENPENNVEENSEVNVEENPEENEVIITNHVAHFYGFRIAYDTMHKANNLGINNRKIRFRNTRHPIDSDELFISSNMFETCGEQDLYNFVIPKSTEYFSFFKCPKPAPADELCELEPF